MSTTTKNLGFIKPELTDVADVTAMNNNWEILDEKIPKVAAEQITGAISNLIKNNLNKDFVLISNVNGKIVVSEVTATELSYLKGLKSNVQHQLDNAAIEVNGAASTIMDSDLTANKMLYSNANGKVAASNVEYSNGHLTFNNTGDYAAVGKFRTVNGATYYVNFGCGVLGGQGIVTMEVRKGTTTTSPMLGRLEIGDLGVSYVDSEGKRRYLVSSEVASATVE